MPQPVEAIYEGGVFRPLAPLTLPEHTRVTLSISSAAPVGMSDEEFERELNEISSHDAPSLPSTFSREDIYFDHD
jgi:predicted DNA-binding antitoxin AbrB/MazE fold protein